MALVSNNMTEQKGRYINFFITQEEEKAIERMLEADDSGLSPDDFYQTAFRLGIDAAKHELMGDGVFVKDVFTGKEYVLGEESEDETGEENILYMENYRQNHER